MKVIQMSDLTERFAALKAAKTPTPLWAFLYIYTHASYECYIGYMEGALALASYLAPLAFPAEPEVPYPDTLHSYETQELAKHLGTTQDIIIHTLLELRASQGEAQI